MNIINIIKDSIELMDGFRKWTIMLLIFIIAVTFRVKNLISGAEFVSMLNVCGGAFFGANSAEHLSDSFQSWLDKKKV